MCFLRQHSDALHHRGRGIRAQGVPDHTSAWGRWREQVGRASRPVTVTISLWSLLQSITAYDMQRAYVKLTDPAFRKHQESLDEGQTWGQAVKTAR